MMRKPIKIKICYFCRKTESTQEAIRGQIHVRVCDKCAKKHANLFDKTEVIEK